MINVTIPYEEYTILLDKIKEYETAFIEIASWPDGGNRYGQDNIKKYAKKILETNREK